MRAEREEIQSSRINSDDKNAEMAQYIEEMKLLQVKVKDLETRLETKRLKCKKWKAEALSLSKVLIEPPSFNVTSPASQLSTSATQLENSAVSTPRYSQTLELPMSRKKDAFSPFRTTGLKQREVFSEVKTGKECENRLKREINVLLQELLGKSHSDQQNSHYFSLF